MDDHILYEGHGWMLKLETATLPDGRTKTVARAHACDASHILALPDDRSILLLREYRPFYGQWVWMIPSGKVDKESDPFIAAGRELQEETGFRADSLDHFFTCRLAERLGYECHVFIAKGLVHDPLPQDATEMIEVHRVTLEEALQKVEEGPVVHTVSALALHRLLRSRQTNG